MHQDLLYFFEQKTEEIIKSQPNGSRFFPFSTYAAGAIDGVGVLAAAIC